MDGDRENKVIAHFRDGTLLKGTTLDFFPSKGSFHLLSENGEVHDIMLDRLKAVFFVRSFEGNPERQERRGFFTRHLQGKKVMIEFEDGEVMFGYTLSYSTRGHGFFVFPGDPQSNNIKVFIVHAATRRVKVRTLPTNYSTQNPSR